LGCAERTSELIASGSSNRTERFQRVRRTVHPEEDSEKIEEEESSENHAFRSNLSNGSYSLSGSRDEQAAGVATSGW
jgi:hypothetical protein